MKKPVDTKKLRADAARGLRSAGFSVFIDAMAAADEIDRLRESIRALTIKGTRPRKGVDPKLIYPGKDPDFVFPPEVE